MNKIARIKKYIGEKIKFSMGRNFEYFYNSGIDAYGQKKYEKAINNFKLAVKQKGIQPQVYYNLALTYQCVKDYDMAIPTYHKFLELNPKDYDGLYNLALTYYLNENFSKAAEFFEKCVEIKKDEDGIKQLILTYLSQNELLKVLKFADDIFQFPQGGIRLYYMIAKVLENKNSFNKDFVYIDKAIEMYSKIIEKDPDFFEAYIAISICYAKKGAFEDSVDFCQQALEVNPKSYEANNQMGLVYDCCNDGQEAVKYYEKALELNPKEDYKIYSNLGYTYEKIGQYDKAIKIFSQLISRFPQCPAKEDIKNHLKTLRTL